MVAAPGEVALDVDGECVVSGSRQAWNYWREMQRNIPALTGIRGYAALWVVVMHYTWGAGGSGEGFWWVVAQRGFAGVIVFLILSGFVLAHTHQEFQHGISGRYWPYFAKRLIRLYPMHIITLSAVALAYWYGYRISDDYSGWSLLLNVFMVHAWGFVNDFSWNAPSWTISVEMFCYLWFPFAAAMLFRLPRVVALVVLAATLYVVRNDSLLPILYNLGFDMTGVNLSWGHYLALFGSVFLGGVALYRLTQGIENLPGWVSDATAVAGLAGLAYACYIPQANWTMMLAALVLIAGLRRGTGIGNLLFGNKLSVFLGEISYALYLVHVILNTVVANNWPFTPLWAKIETTVVVAAVVHFYFDAPVRRWLRGLLKRGTSRDQFPESARRAIHPPTPA